LTEPQAKQTDFSALILAGGQSTRMGQDKALVKIQGIPMLLRVCLVAQEVLGENGPLGPPTYPHGKTHDASRGGEAPLAVYVVTGWPERYQSITPKGCHFIRERDPQGPLSGFAQGLAHIQTEWVLLLACDLPKIKANTLRSWAEALKDLPPSVMALVSRQEKGWEPLCAFYRRASLDSLQQFLHQGGHSFQAWLSQLPVQELALTDEEMLFNCNTPEDVALAERL
jgi:molybdenum cofactor guanylyltransferase